MLRFNQFHSFDLQKFFVAIITSRIVLICISNQDVPFITTGCEGRNSLNPEQTATKLVKVYIFDGNEVHVIIPLIITRLVRGSTVKRVYSS